MSGSKQATMESFGGPDAVECTIARGVTVRGRALTIGEAFRMLKLSDDLQAARDAGADPGPAYLTLLREFVEVAGIQDARVTFTEISEEVLPHFLYRGAESTPSPSSGPSSNTVGTT